MLFTEELKYVLDIILGKSFLGVFSIDNFPQKINRENASFIVNSDPSYNSGEHWMAICIPSNRCACVIFIEPFGLPLHKVMHGAVLDKFFASRKIHTLPFQLQPLTSQTCGHFCAFILAHLPIYNYDLNRLVEREFLEGERKHNDTKVQKWWQRTIKALS